MSYKKHGKKQYYRKPYGWVMGYQCRGKYHVWGASGSRYIPKSVEFVELVVPIKEGLHIPLGAKILKRYKVKTESGKEEERLLVEVPKELLGEFEIFF